MADQEAVKESEKYDYYLTTKDNPYDPKTQYDEWYVYDLMLGYNTLQRLAKTEDYLTKTLRIESENSIHDAAINEIVRLDPLNMYIVRKYKQEPEEVVHSTEEQKQMLELAKSL